MHKTLLHKKAAPKCWSNWHLEKHSVATVSAVEDDNVARLENEEWGIGVIVLLELGLDRDFRKNRTFLVIESTDHDVTQTVNPTHISSFILRTWKIEVLKSYLSYFYTNLENSFVFHYKSNYIGYTTLDCKSALKTKW